MRYSFAASKVDSGTSRRQANDVQLVALRTSSYNFCLRSLTLRRGGRSGEDMNAYVSDISCEAPVVEGLCKVDLADLLKGAISLAPISSDHNVDNSCPCTLTHDSYLSWIAAEKGDVFLRPFHGGNRIVHTHVRIHVFLGRSRPARHTQPIIHQLVLTHHLDLGNQATTHAYL
jgi:hypothetical protein